MPYVRYNLITFDSEKRDAMMSVLNTGLDKVNEIPGLRAVRVHFDTAQGADNRLVYPVSTMTNRQRKRRRKESKPTCLR